MMVRFVQWSADGSVPMMVADSACSPASSSALSSVAGATGEASLRASAWPLRARSWRRVTRAQ